MAGMSLDDALARAEAGGVIAADRPMLRALAYGVLRDHRLLGALLERLLERPLQKQQAEAHALLLAGLYQLRSMRVPAHAAVAETVNATALLDAAHLRGLTNAVLRRYQRERDALEASLPKDAAMRYSCPDWLAAALRLDWPQRWEQILAAANEPGPLTLRVNRRRTTRADYLATLERAGLAARAVAETADAVTLAEAMPVDRLPGFADGDVSVQDAAAQIAVDLLEPQGGQRVLDACAAPGGKTAHILERTDAEVVALDIDAARMLRVAETLGRLKLEARTLVGDARHPAAWWDDRPFDRILLDAPCSATGVIRRHPDIKWLRRADDIPRFAATQLDLLRALWPLLAPRGVLLYATCSLLEAEGAAVVAKFLAGEPTARAEPIEAAWGEASGAGRRLAPGGDFDGFFYARLRRG